MTKRTKTEIKNSGATFTPEALAQFVSEKIFEYCSSLEHPVILDPACGAGSLLMAALHTFEEYSPHLVGFDTDKEYLSFAESNLSRQASSIELHHQDYLELFHNYQDGLFSKNPIGADIIIANPPYVRTQNLGAERAQMLAQQFNLSGRIDLYFPFLKCMTYSLKEGGIIGVITSNRYLSTKSGADIRSFLLSNYEILEIIDLGDTKIFDAAVLPAIFIGKRKNNPHQTSCRGSRIYESQGANPESAIPAGSIYELISKPHNGLYKVGDFIYRVDAGQICFSNSGKEPWQITSDSDDKWLETIRRNSGFFVGDVFKVRVGIKSCADNVFLNPKWKEESFIPEKDLLRTLISQENLVRWGCDYTKCSKALYPHYSVSGKKAVYDIAQYPNACKYLEKHRKQLTARKYLMEAGRNWYELWVPQNPALWLFPKVVFPDISVSPRFCFDNSGAIVNGNCYWIVAQTNEELNLLYLIEGVANSSLMERYHDLSFNNKLYSGRRRYLTQYIAKYPMPPATSPASQKIISLVKQINTTSNPKEIARLEAEINVYVYQAFGIIA